MKQATIKRFVRTQTTTEVCIPASLLRGLLKAPEDARLTVRVPSGGDWSGTDLELDDATQCPAVTYTEIKEEER